MLLLNQELIHLGEPPLNKPMRDAGVVVSYVLSSFSDHALVHQINRNRFDIYNIVDSSKAYRHYYSLCFTYNT